ncbi:MAG: ABC transporter ATP-binding protein [Bacilli bacterium]|nr:ABC transporter ATP-binding protein [Bacilli bacterium]
MLEVSHAFLNFNGLQAINDVSIKVNDGTITAMIGPNGAGKTTLFNIIAGVYKPDSGVVTLDGVDITGKKPFEICNYGITRTYQVIKLFTGMSALDNVLVGMHINYKLNFFQDVFHTKKMRQLEKETKERAMELLRLVGLEDYAGVTASSLSYGQQRLLEIARALGSNPKLLLLDEPAAGMNLKEKNDLCDRLRIIKNMGITILIVEHDMSLVMNVAEEIFVINSGKNLAYGTPDEIANNKDVIEAYLGSGD